jgi:alpha-methylacyl-CoA racemase
MGPLAGIKIVEFAGIGPGPMAAMLLADLGATVLQLDRTEASGLGIDKPVRFDLLKRGRNAVGVDLKRPEGVALALRLLEKADACIEGFRPGTMERLGLGPETVLERNPRLVYGRMTGFGQSGPLAKAAGHDLNYIALTGALAAIGRKGQAPAPPLNLLGDFAGGSLYLVVGMLAALLEAKTSGRGQVVDAAITDGTAHLMTMIYGIHAAGMHSLERGANLLDSGTAYYDVYECADGTYVSVAPIEAKFRQEFFQRLGIEAPASDEELRTVLQERFRTKTRDEWCRLLEGTDACFAPVLDMQEAPLHPHNVARGTFVEIGDVLQPAPAPRFSRSAVSEPAPPQPTGQDGRKVLGEWGVRPDEIESLTSSGALIAS